MIMPVMLTSLSKDEELYGQTCMAIAKCVTLNADIADMFERLGACVKRAVVSHLARRRR